MRKVIILLALAIIFSCGTAIAQEITDPTTLIVDSTLTVPSGVTLSITSWDSLSTVRHIIIESGGTLNNYVFTGVVEINNTGTFNNFGRVINVRGIENTGIINNTGELQEYGTLNNFGLLENHGVIHTDGSRIYNYGIIKNFATMHNPRQIYNYATFENMNILHIYGLLENRGTINNTGIIINDQGYIDNYGTINNTNSIQNSETMNNYGTITNAGTITLIFPSSIINNHGLIDSLSGRIDIRDGHIYNYPGAELYGLVEERYISQVIPEFPTIAVPMIAIIGLAMFFKRR